MVVGAPPYTQTVTVKTNNSYYHHLNPHLPPSLFLLLICLFSLDPLLLLYTFISCHFIYFLNYLNVENLKKCFVWRNSWIKNEILLLNPLKVFDLFTIPQIFISLSDSPQSTISLYIYIYIYLCVWVCDLLSSEVCFYLQFPTIHHFLCQVTTKTANETTNPLPLHYTCKEEINPTSNQVKRVVYYLERRGAHPNNSNYPDRYSENNLFGIVLWWLRFLGLSILTVYKYTSNKKLNKLHKDFANLEKRIHKTLIPTW